MNKITLFLIVVIVICLSFVGFSRVEAQSPYPEIKVTYFQATPQALAPEVRNSGTLYLELRLNGFDLEDLDEGRVSIQNRDGAIYKIGNIWSCQDQACTWNQYLPIEAVDVWVDVLGSIEWEGWGPWEADINDGLRKKEDVTEITFSINDPLYRDWEGLYDPTWDWSVVGEPEWAAAQWFEHGRVDITVDTNCNTHGTNHEGMFSWENVPTLPSMFGNGVFRSLVMEPMTTLQWEIKSSVGNWWTQTGETTGPSCWVSTVFLPLINN